MVQNCSHQLDWYLDLHRLDFVFCLKKLTLFGQLWRLEPLRTEKKEMWRREMKWLLCVSDHIVEMTLTWQTFLDGTNLRYRLRIAYCGIGYVSCSFFFSQVVCLRKKNTYLD